MSETQQNPSRSDRDETMPEDGVEIPIEGSDEEMTIAEDFPITVDRYKLVREITRGGQAVIFMAIQKSTGRKVAIKFLPGGPLGSDVERSRMEQEVRILAALDHPNIVSVIDRGETPEGWMYFVLEYVHGKILAEYLDELRQQYPPLGILPDYSDLLRLFARICEAVNAAHMRGIVHRDVKPSNIIVDAHGEPHILDFGVARTAIAWPGIGEDTEPNTATGEFLGSLQWASPEQAEGDISKVDIRTDVYSLGVILYEMLTGEFPYEVFGRIRETLDNIVNARPRPPSAAIEARIAERRQEDKTDRAWYVNPVDPDLDAIVLKALSKKREDRYQTAGELGKAILAYVNSRAGTTRPYRIVKPSRRGVAAAAVAALIVAGGVGLWGWHRHAARRGADDDITITLPDNTFGYRIEAGQVVFEFDPREFGSARTPGGGVQQVSTLGDIRSVQVAGAFNAWDPVNRDWAMNRVDRHRFVLRKPISLFSERVEWPFKFVINDGIWVGAPSDAVNKEMVVTDPTTYNLVFVNPLAKPSDERLALAQYRARIEAAWPGQGPNLAVDEKGGFHFTFTHWPSRTALPDLEPLRSIPLASLAFGDVTVGNLEALRDMPRLEVVTMGEAMYAALLGPMRDALDRDDFAGAEMALDDALAGLENVPAFQSTRSLFIDGIANYRALSQTPPLPAPAVRSFGGHRYAFIAKPMTWIEAREFAIAQKGSLPAITGRREQEWITATFGFPSLGSGIWLGGTDEMIEGSWGWLTAERWDYENWDAGQPNNFMDKENALAMKPAGWWVDADGETVKLPFLIEWDK